MQDIESKILYGWVIPYDKWISLLEETNYKYEDDGHPFTDADNGEMFCGKTFLCTHDEEHLNFDLDVMRERAEFFLKDFDSNLAKLCFKYTKDKPRFYLSTRWRV